MFEDTGGRCQKGENLKDIKIKNTLFLEYILGRWAGAQDKPYLAYTKHPTLYSPVLKHCRHCVVLKLELVAFPWVFLTGGSNPNIVFLVPTKTNHL